MMARRSVMTKPRTSTEQLKREAVGLTRQPNGKVSQVARAIGLGTDLPARWQRERAGTSSKHDRNEAVGTRNAT
jgi:transposase-like protein